MKIVGIVAEFNPMHNGHKYLLEKAKEITGADMAICIMSGNFTQAGNIGIENKFVRSKIAIENGFDLVIELPTIFATTSAEFFCYGAINILNSLGCLDYLCFGSETGNTKELITIAKKLLDNEANIWDIITESLKEGISFAKAREYAISKFLTAGELEISGKSNNILGIEYIKSLIKLNSKIEPIAIKRNTSPEFLSSKQIRDILQNYSYNNMLQQYILGSEQILKYPKLNDNMYEIIKYSVISNGKEKLKDIYEVTEGLENKIYNEVSESISYNDYIQNVKSKRYQLSKIKRILVNIILGITKDKFLYLNNNECCYAHILAINPSKKSDILSLINKNTSIPIITSLSDDKIKTLPCIVQKSLYLDIKASNIHSIINNSALNKDYTNKL